MKALTTTVNDAIGRIGGGEGRGAAHLPGEHELRLEGELSLGPMGDRVHADRLVEHGEHVGVETPLDGEHGRLFTALLRGAAARHSEQGARHAEGAGARVHHGEADRRGRRLLALLGAGAAAWIAAAAARRRRPGEVERLQVPLLEHVVGGRAVVHAAHLLVPSALLRRLLERVMVARCSTRLVASQQPVE